MSSPAIIVTTPEELKALIKQAVRELEEEGRAEDEAKPVTEDGLAKARKSLRRFGRGA
jgi:KaiC/GvpD/RAD55 family RecA-like ATPase